METVTNNHTAIILNISNNYYIEKDLYLKLLFEYIDKTDWEKHASTSSY